MLIFAADLDNTLIFGRHKLLRDDVLPVENYEIPSHMISHVHETINKLHDEIMIVPVTTRSIAQYSRLNIFNKLPKLAFCSNGGNLLIEGKVNEHFADIYMGNIGDSLNQMENIVSYLESLDCKIRNVDNLFYYTKTDDNFLREKLVEKLPTDLVEIELSADKFYVFPKTLNKGIAIDYLRKTHPDAFLIAAGDSYMDNPMLEKADIALCTDKNPIEIGKSCENENFSEFIINYLLHHLHK